MNQVGYEKEWLHLLDMYVRPLQEAAFVGYYQKVFDHVYMRIRNVIDFKNCMKVLMIKIFIASEGNYEFHRPI